MEASNPYGAPPGYGGYGNQPPGMSAPPGLGAPPPGVPARPGMPPGMQQANAPPASFQPPNLPNINFNAPVIRLGTTGPAGGNDRGDGPRQGGRPGLGMDRGQDQGRSSNREITQVLIPPTAEEKLRTMFIHEIPDGVGGDGIQKILSAVGRLRRWEALDSVTDDHKGAKFGFALFEDVESLHNAARLLVEEQVEVPKKKQPIATEQPKDDTFEDIEKVNLQTSLDASTIKYLEAFRKEEEEADAGEAHARAQLKQALRDLFYPLSASVSKSVDTMMANAGNGEAVEVVNIGMAQEDELSDIPAEIREVVLKEIAAFRERSTQHDLERLRGEEEFEEQERRRMGASRPVAHDGSNGTPLGPRGAPSGPRGHNGSNGTSFVNGGVENGSISYRDDDTDASDEELQRRRLHEEKTEANKLYKEAERKWANRERSRQAALERERNRERDGEAAQQKRAQASIAHDKEWDDEREKSHKSHPYYRDHAAWVRKRAMDRADEEAKDEADRRQEEDEQHRAQAQMERARGMADSFLDKQAEESDRRETEATAAAAATAAAPQPFKLSLGAAAQKAQASRGATQRRTVAEVEGLLDDEEEQAGTRRQLIPIEYDASTTGRGSAADSGLTDEEISQAVRALAQEIPSDKEGLWRWAVQWEYMDDGVIADKLKPFVERKIVEYLGVREEMLVDTVEEHLRKHGTAAALAEELEGALDDEAEDLVKKLWRMVIFFTESEKRGLPA
ncbi:Splicing factor PWI [Akanthomyces lecanii RCEF 1005]|uniref:Splicing factor PWI n=1 Tax=Akanthomyces lecanii RCEF 1005 TaxID=1081108 RepID=A0A168GKB7_CORDF|nr:Splicing factor PWI [Akanthomyces lecanii RCEF 1005]